MTRGAALRLTTCPTTTIHASPEIVWALLTEPTAYPWWAGTVTRADPPGSARAGQRVELAARALGAHLRIDVHVLDVQESPRRLRVDVRLPFGVANHEVVSCVTLGSDAAFVTFN